ncbi:MAG: hypothetical protein ACAH11_08025 [Sphingomonas sp.]
MNNSSEDPAASAAMDGCAFAFVALLGSSFVASLLLTGLIGWASLWPVFWVITFFVGALIGLPLYFAASKTDRVTAPMAAGGGFVTAAFFPGIAMLQSISEDPRLVAPLFAVGGCGAISGLVFLLILRSLAPNSPPAAPR